ncbi:hypothetical protein JVT61DRAFT_5137 [Boletus reticuloceps]|uniref:MYND-type domain-containing protein n=1 Tax=Boletus reticuloceps TaxID=495285 RepID=A0A8I2YWK4_9AGAM|nr:hypothetical protein JVT61DRAFT_5137 [Boletus reticuloceps]
MVPLSTSDLNNPVTFPTFLNLPAEYEINDAYFSSTKPRKHWCFLGRVISSNVMVRLSLEVEDKKGHRILVAFHTDDRGASFQAQCTPGSTIAVLYATQHIFAFSPPGVRLEESAYIRVFPYTLEAMLRTSKAIFERDRAARCEVCGRADANVKKCARCKTAWYCSKMCQTNGWVAHKDECNVFRDVQWFVTRNWETGVHAHAFPVERVHRRALAQH